MINNKIVELEDIQDIGVYFIEFQTHSPYDGCFWEYNYLFVRDNEIHDDFIDACTTQEPIETVEQLKAYQDNETWRNDNFIVYDVSNGLNLDKFPYTVLQGLSDTLQNAGIDVGFTCSECGNFEENPEYIHSEGYTGNGGAGIEMTDAMCGECHAIGLCSECGEYAGQNDIFSFDEKYICEYCLEKALAYAGYVDLDNEICDYIFFDKIDLRTPLYNKLSYEYRNMYVNKDLKQIYAYNTGGKTDYKILEFDDIIDDRLALLFYDGDDNKLQNARQCAILKETNLVLFTV